MHLEHFVSQSLYSEAIGKAMRSMSSMPRSSFIAKSSYDNGAPEKYPSIAYTSAVATATLSILVMTSNEHCRFMKIFVAWIFLEEGLFGPWRALRSLKVLKFRKTYCFEAFILKKPRRARRYDFLCKSKYTLTSVSLEQVEVITVISFLKL